MNSFYLYTNNLIILLSCLALTQGASYVEERATFEACDKLCLETYLQSLDNTPNTNVNRDTEGDQFATFTTCTRGSLYTTNYDTDLKADWADFYDNETLARDDNYHIQQDNLCSRLDLIPVLHTSEYMYFNQQCDINCGLDLDTDNGFLNGYLETNIMEVSQLKTCKNTCIVNSQLVLDELYVASYNNLNECKDICKNTSDAKITFYQRTQRDFWIEKIENCMQQQPELNIDETKESLIKELEKKNKKEFKKSFFCVQYRYEYQNEQRDQSANFNNQYWENRQNCENFCSEQEVLDGRGNQQYTDFKTCEKQCYSSFYKTNNFNSNDLKETYYEKSQNILRFSLLFLFIAYFLISQ